MNSETEVLASPTQEDTDTALKLWVVLNRAGRAISDRIRGSVEQHDLSLSEFGVLEVLYSKGRMLVGEAEKKSYLPVAARLTSSTSWRPGASCSGVPAPVTGGPSTWSSPRRGES